MTLELTVVHALERDPPKGEKPLEWFVLTTLTVASAEQAAEILRWYRLRWRIEDWHRVLKSGCKIDELGHHSVDRLERAIAIRLVIAWPPTDGARLRQTHHHVLRLRFER